MVDPFSAFCIVVSREIPSVTVIPELSSIIPVNVKEFTPFAFSPLVEI